MRARSPGEYVLPGGWGEDDGRARPVDRQLQIRSRPMRLGLGRAGPRAGDACSQEAGSWATRCHLRRPRSRVSPRACRQTTTRAQSHTLRSSSDVAEHAGRRGGPDGSTEVFTSAYPRQVEGGRPRRFLHSLPVAIVSVGHAVGRLHPTLPIPAVSINPIRRQVPRPIVTEARAVQPVGSLIHRLADVVLSESATRRLLHLLERVHIDVFVRIPFAPRVVDKKKPLVRRKHEPQGLIVFAGSFLVLLKNDSA